MLKAGASYRDKARIRKMHLSGNYSLEQIAASTSVHPKHVLAIIKQVDAGTLKLSGTGRATGGDYGEGDQDTDLPPPLEQSAAELKLINSLEADNKALAEELTALKEKFEEVEIDRDDDDDDDDDED